MKKFVPFLTLALILGFALDLRGQNITATNVTTQTVTLPASDAVAQVTSFFGSSAVFGTTPYYYWFVSRTVSNVSPPAGPLVVQAPASLSSLNNISITWTPIGGGVTSYDVLRTATSATPTGACNCAVALATTLANVTDSGAALLSYTVSAVGSNWTLQNKLSAGTQALMAFYQGQGYEIAPSSSNSSGAGNTNAIFASPSCPVVATANCYFVNDNVKFCLDATISSGSAIVTSAGQCSFTAADVGKLIVGTNMGAFGLSVSSVSLFPAGTTISSLNSSASVNVSNNATGNCAASSSKACPFAYGTDDTTNLNAAWAATGNGQGCNSLILPAGNMFFSSAIFTVIPAGSVKCLTTTGAGSFPPLASMLNTVVEISGQGNMATMLIPTPTLSNSLASLCTGGAGSNVCVGGISGVSVHNWGLWGMGQNALGSNAVALAEFGSEGTQIYDFAATQWDAGDTNTSNFGFLVINFTALNDSMIMGFGRIGTYNNGGPAWITNTWINGGALDLVTSGTTASHPLKTSGNTYFVGVPGSGGGAGVNNQGFWESVNDYVFDSDANANHNDLLMNSGSVASIKNLTIFGDNASGSAAIQLLSGSIVHCNSCKLGNTMPNGLINAGTFFDEGANDFSQATTPYSGSGTYNGPPSPAILSFTNATIASNISVTANTVTTLMTATPSLPFIGGSYRATINYSVYIVGGTIGMSWLSDGTHTGGMSYCGTVSNNFSFCSGSWTTPVQYTGSNPTFTLLFIDSGTATACSSVLSGGSCGAVSGLSNIVNVPASMQISLVQSN